MLVKGLSKHDEWMVRCDCVKYEHDCDRFTLGVNPQKKTDHS